MAGLPTLVSVASDGHHRGALVDLGRTSAFGPLRAYAHHGFPCQGHEVARVLVDALDAPHDLVLATVDGDDLDAALSLHLSPWETDVLGVRVGRLAEAVVHPEAPDPLRSAEALYRGAADRWAEDGGGLLIARIDVGDATSLAAAQRAGFEVYETRITYLCDHDLPPDHHHQHRGFEVRRHVGAEIGEIGERHLGVLRRWVAETDRPGHFYSSPHLSRAQVERLYLSWLERTFDGRWGDIVYTAWRDGDLVGFLCWLDRPDLRERYGLHTLTAGLGAAASPEGAGSLGDMYQAVCTDRPLGTRFVEHTSQAGNGAVLTTWSRFHAIRPGAAQYVLHGWFGGR